jgi:uncharacterized protein (DUF1330 family)
VDAFPDPFRNPTSCVSGRADTLGFDRRHASGGRFLARGLPAKTYEGGIDQRTVLVEFDSLAQAIAAHDSPGYQAALAVLGNAAERDLRIVEGIDG